MDCGASQWGRERDGVRYALIVEAEQGLIVVQRRTRDEAVAHKLTAKRLDDIGHFAQKRPTSGPMSRAARSAPRAARNISTHGPDETALDGVERSLRHMEQSRGTCILASSPRLNRTNA